MPHRIEFSSPKERAASAIVTAGVAGLIGWALVVGLTVRGRSVVTDALESFAVIPPAPPPPRPVPPPRPRPARHRPKDAAAPPNLHATPTEIVAPPPVLLPPPQPVVAAPIASTRTAPRAGAADIAGPGTGAGGQGNGLGGGGNGIGSWVHQTSRDLRVGDLPPGVLPANAHLMIYFAFTVGADGRVRDCRIERSSGIPGLDAATCSAAEQRLRFAPARDRAGRRIAVTVRGEQAWDDNLRDEPDDPDP